MSGEIWLQVFRFLVSVHKEGNLVSTFMVISLSLLMNLAGVSALFTDGGIEKNAELHYEIFKKSC